jgi:hypothetical protein
VSKLHESLNGPSFEVLCRSGEWSDVKERPLSGWIQFGLDSSIDPHKSSVSAYALMVNGITRLIWKRCAPKHRLQLNLRKDSSFGEWREECWRRYRPVGGNSH